jgi:hypothetical protein
MIQKNFASGLKSVEEKLEISNVTFTPASGVTSKDGTYIFVSNNILYAKFAIELSTPCSVNAWKNLGSISRTPLFNTSNIAIDEATENPIGVITINKYGIVDMYTTASASIITNAVIVVQCV